MSADEILPHKPIQKLSENLWRVQGDLPHFGMQRVMTIAKRAAGDLVIHSAIKMDEASMREMEAFGEPTYLLIPHSRHRLDAPKFKRRYPKLIVLATNLGARRSVRRSSSLRSSPRSAIAAAPMTRFAI